MMTIRSFPNIGQSCPSHIDQQLILCQLHVTLTIICISYFTFLRIVSYKPRYSPRKDVIVTCENLKDIRNIRHRNMYTFIPTETQNFNQLVLITKSSLAKLTTYHKFILLLFFITNKFDRMKYNISRVIVRTFANPISIISQYRYTNVSCNVISQLFLL